MDRSLDDMILDRQGQRSSNSRSRRGGDQRRMDSHPRDGVRKSYREDPRDLDKAWIHDRYEDDHFSRRSRDTRDNKDYDYERGRGGDRYASDDDRRYREPARIRIENLHYDLTESDLRELFTRIGKVVDCEILYDRSDRSRGIAYVSYASVRDANRAVQEFDGANAYGQPIRLTLLPAGASSRGGGRLAPPPASAGRSLFDRIEDGAGSSGSGGRNSSRRRDGGRRDERSSGIRRTDMDREDIDNGDRYNSGERPRGGRRQARSRSPMDISNPPRRGGGGRRPGARREGSRRENNRDNEGHKLVGGRPRKTAEELDAEMADYWGSTNNGEAADKSNGAAVPNGMEADATGAVAVGNPAAAAPASGTEDIDMIE